MLCRQYGMNANSPNLFNSFMPIRTLHRLDILTYRIMHIMSYALPVAAVCARFRERVLRGLLKIFDYGSLLVPCYVDD